MRNDLPVMPMSGWFAPGGALVTLVGIRLGFGLAVVRGSGRPSRADAAGIG